MDYDPNKLKLEYKILQLELYQLSKFQHALIRWLMRKKRMLNFLWCFCGSLYYKLTSCFMLILNQSNLVYMAIKTTETDAF